MNINNIHIFSTDSFQLADVITQIPNEFLVESEIHRKYNNYRTIMNSDNNNIKDLLAEARAIHFAMRNGAITYEEAKLRVQPILRSVNDHIGRIAKGCKVKPKYIKFQDLGRNL